MAHVAWRSFCVGYTVKISKAVSDCAEFGGVAGAGSYPALEQNSKGDDLMANIRDILKQREQQRDQATKGDSEFPEGVTRYVRMGSHGEVNKDGKTFVMLASPDDWFVYFVHMDRVFEGKTIHKFRKHSCLHSPHEASADITKYFRPGKDECISCKAGAKRKMFFMVPVYDPEYKTFRVLDVAEFHANNLIADFDKAEKMGRKFNPNYTLVGEAVHIKQVDKSYSLESGDLDEKILEEAKSFIGFDFNYEELANFREESDIVQILREADDTAVDKSVLPESEQAGDDQQFEF